MGIVLMTDSDRREMIRIKSFVDSLTGDGLSNTPYGAAIAAQVARGSSGSSERPRPPFTFFEITDATAIDASNDQWDNPTQWTYAVKEVVKTAVGYDGWNDKTDGWTGDGFNFAEIGNTGTGRQGNGVDHDGTDYIEWWNMEAVGTGLILPGVILNVVVDNTNTQEGWFWPFPNGEDGTCSEP
jgi:hypothetical protein